jgi:apolipoprotein N-acyltransferase
MAWREWSLPPRLVDPVVVLVSGSLMYAGTGLHAVGWLTWFFPVPLLLLAPHRSARRAGLLALAAGLVGTSNLVHYGLVVLQLPPGLVAALVLGQAVLLTAYVVTWRGLVVRHRLVLASLSAPAVWVLGEWAIARSPAVGAWLSLGTTQADVPVLLAVTAYAGTWGLTFLVLAGPALACSVARSPGAGRRTAGGLAAVGLVAVAAVPAGAVAVERHRDGGPKVLVAGVAVPQPYDPVDVSSPAGRDLLATFVTEVDRLAGRGARLVVLPEKSFSAATGEEGWLAPLQEVADRRGVVVVVGSVETGSGQPSNLAVALRPDARPASYAKHFLVPSYESDFRAGTTRQTVTSDAAAVGLEICKDLDFPGLSRAYARSGAGLLAVPAWDFDTDAWWHSRIAVVRGVETGTTVVRVARNGALTTSDPSGRVLVDHRTRPGQVTTMLVSVRPGTHDTVYDRWGDWFVIVCAGLVLVGWAGTVRRSSRRAPDGATPVLIDSSHGNDDVRRGGDRAGARR